MEASKKLIENYKASEYENAELTPVYNDLDARMDRLQQRLSKLKRDLPAVLTQFHLGQIDESRVTVHKSMIAKAEGEIADLELALPHMAQRLSATAQIMRACRSKAKNAFNRLHALIDEGERSTEVIEVFEEVVRISPHQDHHEKARALFVRIEEEKAAS
jgi:cob(I)alamin adenosyltransferase